MRIVNETRNGVISENSDFARSVLSRIRGLMLSRPKDLVLVSPKEDIRSSTIHMLFMLFPIDVIWVDSGNSVVDLQRNIRAFNPLKKCTWRTYKPGKPAKYVIELGSGNIADTEIGDKIGFLHSKATKALHNPL
jgi:uncharacterized membrane protein (UPF0127 family)